VNEVFSQSPYEYFDFYCLTDALRLVVEDVFADLILGKPVRRTFIFDREAFARRPVWRGLVPDGCTMDVSNERYAARLMRQVETLSECSACFVGGGQAEITVETHENHRRMGYAELVCSAFIEHCLERGHTPNWGCWDFKAGSVGLAKKLGFTELADEVVYGLKNPRG